MPFLPFPQFAYFRRTFFRDGTSANEVENETFFRIFEFVLKAIERIRCQFSAGVTKEDKIC